MPFIMMMVCLVGIVGLFLLDPETKPRPSLAAWIPVGWLFLNCSRPPSTWLWILGLGSAPQATGGGYVEGSPFDALIYTALLVGGLAVLASRFERVRPYLRKMGPILLFFFYCLVSVLWSDYPFVAFKHWNKGIADLVVGLVLLTDPEPAAALKRLFNRIGFVLIPLSILFIKYFPVLGRSYGEGGMPEYQGAAIQKNGLGMICIVFGFGALWRILEVYKNRQTPGRTNILVAQGVLLTMILYLFRTSDAMTSLTCFAMGVTIMLLLSWRTIKRIPIFLHVVVLSMVSLAVFAVFFDSTGSLVGSLGRNSTLTGRTAIWQAIIPFATNPLIGTGYESFWLGDRLQEFWRIQGGAFHQIQEAHNGYIEVYLNLGWIGVVLLGFVIVTGYRKVFARVREDAYAGSLGLAFFVTEIVYSITEAGFRMMFPLWILFLMASLGMPSTPITETATVNADLPADSRNRNFGLPNKPSKGFAMRPQRPAVLETSSASVPFKSKRNDF